MAKLIKGYNGTDYFWNYAYRHSLRDCSVKARRQVYAAFKRNGLALDGFTLEHSIIVLRYTRTDATRVRKMGIQSDTYNLDQMRVKPLGC